VNDPVRLLTIGHSTVTADAFLAMLAAHRVELLTDARRLPASRRHPQFNREALEEMLASQNIGYLHFPELGGRREAGFRGYADYMETTEFNRGITRLLKAAKARVTAIMCAE
jgi:uncharacterized protein (DUF488 family)